MPTNNLFSLSSMCKQAVGAAVALALAAPCSSALAQATSRLCNGGSEQEEQAGPACLLAHQSVGKLEVESVYWNLDKYPSVEAAERNKAGDGTIVNAFGSAWLFTLGSFRSGAHTAQVGPILVEKNTAYDAEFLKSTFSPGMTAPIHVHSGPEAFYAVSGDTCLETPDGVQVARGAGNSLLVRAGPPMLLMALGIQPRKGFALILHGASLPPTTLVHDWTPKGLCVAEMH